MDITDFAPFQLGFRESDPMGSEPGNLAGDEMTDLDDFDVFAAALNEPG